MQAGRSEAVMGLTVVVGDAEGMGLLYAADAYIFMRHASSVIVQRG